MRVLAIEPYKRPEFRKLANLEAIQKYIQSQSEWQHFFLPSAALNNKILSCNRELSDV